MHMLSHMSVSAGRSLCLGCLLLIYFWTRFFIHFELTHMQAGHSTRDCPATQLPQHYNYNHATMPCLMYVCMYLFIYLFIYIYGCRGCELRSSSLYRKYFSY